MRASWSIWTALYVCTANALHAYEAGIVDWHKPFLGIPLTRPIFHRTALETGATKSLVLTATSSNVVGAVHPENGTLGMCSCAYVITEREYIWQV